MFFCVHGWSPLAQEIPTHQYLLRPTHSSYLFLLGPLVSASAGARPPLYGIIRRNVGWSSRVYGGYEVDGLLVFALLLTLFGCFVLAIFGAI